MKTREFREYAEQRGFIEKGEMTGAVFSFTTNRARLKIFQEFFGDGRVHSVVGASAYDQILERLIQEAKVEWLEQGEQQMKGQQ
jgi:hypothetical protein